MSEENSFQLYDCGGFYSYIYNVYYTPIKLTQYAVIMQP